VAFGDDAAVAGGLVVDQDGLPRFCADAIADPLTGLAAADACLEALEAGGRWLLDVSMAAVAAEMAGPTLPLDPVLEASPPRARNLLQPAVPLGSHTAEVLAEFGLTS
jgi:crotonobetainyl-CoA:carnitine CoA-transferase CaiB-like acyl-CoA transferase